MRDTEGGYTARVKGTGTAGAADSSADEHGELLPLDAVEEESLIGDGIAYLLTHGHWVHRRVDLIRFLDASTVNRQMSVDFTLPQVEATRSFYELRPGLVPLGTLWKRKLQHFSLWDEAGRRLPMLTTDENGFYAGAALVALGWGFVDEYEEFEGDLPEAMRNALRAVAQRPRPEAELLLSHLQRPSAELTDEVLARVNDAYCRQLLEKVAPHMPMLRRFFEGPEGGRPQEAGPERDAYDRRANASKTFRSLTGQLAGQFIVLAQFPVPQFKPNERRIVKFENETPFNARRADELTGWVRARRFLRTVAEYMNWWPSQRNFEGVAVGTAKSYHVEIEAPADIDLLRANFSATDGERTFKDEWDEPERQRAHLQISGATRDAVGPVWVRMRPAATSWLFAALGTSVFVVVLLYFGWKRLPSIHHELTPLDPAAAILLSFPGIVGIYLLRGGEHDLARRMLWGPRALLVLSAGCAVFAAVVLAGAYPVTTQEQDWRLARDIAYGAAGGLLLSLVMPHLAAYIRRAWGWTRGHTVRLWSSALALGTAAYEKVRSKVANNP